MMYKIVPVTTESAANKITCFKLGGFKGVPVVPQGILPNATLYKVCCVRMCMCVDETTIQTDYNEKALKCKPLANCACAIPLIDGLGY